MNPILALDIGSMFAIGFLLISFIGWIMNLVNAQNPPAQPKQQGRRPQARDGKVQNEIEEFLQEAMGRRAPQEQPPVTDDIEILEPAPRQRRRPLTRRPPKQPQRPKPAPSSSQKVSQASASLQPGERLAARHVTSSPELGTGVRSHLQEHMELRVTEQAEQHLSHQVDQSVFQHLGDFRADDRDTRRTVAPFVRSRAAVSDPLGLIADLRHPAGMRKAIVLQEILAKPRALQKG